jgi:hypothetical protein
MTRQPNPIDWTPPDGLGYSSARPVQLAAGGWVLVVLGALFLIGGPLLAWFLSGQIERDKERNRLLAEQGVETTATIVRVWRESDKEGTHMVSYRFSADGSEITGRSKMYRNVWSNLHTGDSLPIRYLPLRPEVNHPAQATPGPAPDWVPWLVSGFFVWPPFLFWWMIRRQTGLLAEGRPAPATVTQIRRAKQVIAYYEFRLLDGAVVKGRSQVSRRNIPQPGQQATVLYLPDNPKRNALYPLELVKLQK